MPELAVAERTLPHNLEAERSVLGAILLHNDAFNLAAEVIDAGDFFRDAHRRIFDKMVKLVERGDVGGAADLVELARAAELFLERHQIDRVAAFDELHHLVEDAAVRVAEEILRVDHLGGEVEGVVVQQNRAEDGSFGFEIMRKRACGYCEFWHQS